MATLSHINRFPTIVIILADYLITQKEAFIHLLRK